MRRVSAELVNKAAATVVSILTRLGYSCALSGDFVCHHFGFERKPRQVDVVVFSRNPQPSLENLRLQVSQESPKHFFTSWAGKTKVFYFCDLELKTRDPKSCIVSITYLDSTLHIKTTKNGLPLVPISYTLLQKLEDWAESLTENLPRHQNSPDLDVQMLLKIVNTMSAKALATESLPPLLWDLSRHKILRFISEYHGYASAWEKLGFTITPRVPKAVTPPPVQRPKSPTIVRSPEVLIEAEGPDMPPIENPTRTQMVMMAARDSIRLLARCGWRSAIFGSLACFLYGNIRVPNDVDLLVIPPEACTTVNAEDLKQILLSLDPYHFYVTTPKDPTASYRILWYRLTDDPTQTVQTSCKVDILLPGVMHLPNIPPSLVHWDEGLPLIPFSLLLLQKLQAWDDHRHSKDPVKWQRQRTDMEDLKNLFELSIFHPLKESLPWTDATLFSLEFQRLTKERVVAYVNAFPDSAPAWISIGF